MIKNQKKIRRNGVVVKYIECSALLQTNVTNVFDEAVKLAMHSVKLKGGMWTLRLIPSWTLGVNLIQSPTSSINSLMVSLHRSSTLLTFDLRICLFVLLSRRKLSTDAVISLHLLTVCGPA